MPANRTLLEPPNVVFPFFFFAVRGSRQKTIPDVQKWYTGVGYFSDPRGKPGFFRYVAEVFRFIRGFLTLRMKEPSAEAIEASGNPANGTPEDGVVVRYGVKRERGDGRMRDME